LSDENFYDHVVEPAIYAESSLILCSIAMKRVMKTFVVVSDGILAPYTGEIDAQDKPNGYGELAYLPLTNLAEAHVDMGVFVDGALHGIGKRITPSGFKRTGEFVRGLLDGVALYEHPRGDLHFGHFKGSMRHGFGIETLRDGKKTFGWWKNDTRDGIALKVSAQGIKVAVVYACGNLISERKSLMEVECKKW
jgi:hypothetical protein